MSLHDGTSVGLRLHDIAQAGADGAEILAVAGDGAPIGRTTYVRLYGPRAELTLDVDDGFWHRGVPGALLDELVAHAASRGISTLIARVPASDVRLLALLRERVQGRAKRDGRHVVVEFAATPRPKA